MKECNKSKFKKDILPKEIFNVKKSKSLASIIERAEDLILKAKRKGIKLKIFNKLYRQYQITEIKRSIFKKAFNMLQKLINRAELPCYTEECELIQLMLDGKFYLKRGDPGFQKAREGLYGGIIYDIICKSQFSPFSDFFEKHYIGRTHKSKFERMLEHVEASLDPYEDHTRKIEQAVILALKQELNLYQLWEEYQYLSSMMKKRLLKKITKKLLEKYFDLIIIEVHKNYSTTYAREKWYIKNYKHYVKGKLTKGTKNPNGLNMIISSGPKKYISLPLYDIAFMVAIGYKPKLIAKMLNKVYNIKVNSLVVNTRIRDFWQSWEEAQEKFLKPVIQALIEQNDYKFYEIRDAFFYTHKGFYKLFKRLFVGMTFNQIKLAQTRNDFSWESLMKIAEDFKDEDKLRGIPISKWKKWFIKGISLEDIAKLTGFNSDNGIRTFLNENKEAIKKLGGGYEKAVDKFRRERTIKLLLNKKNRITLEWIYVYDFGLKTREDYKCDNHFERQLANFFERLFDYKLTVDDLRSRNPHKLLKFLD